MRFASSSRGSRPVSFLKPLFSLLFVSLFYSSLVSALPQGEQNLKRALVKKLPTLAECRKLVHVTSDKALFWSGTGQTLPAQVASKLGLQMDKDAYPSGFSNQGAGASPKDLRQFQNDFSQAYAEAASGTVYVLVPKTGPDPTRVFASVEYPALKKNSKVKSIKSIDPSTGKVAGEFVPNWHHKRHLKTLVNSQLPDPDKMHKSRKRTNRDVRRLL